MARPTWKGSISFGLVTIGVHLYPATESHTISFHQYRRGSGERIRHRRVGEHSGEDVPYEDIVKGYDTAGGEQVILEPEELDSVEPRRSRTIDIDDFVELDDVDPLYFRSGYYVTPADEDAATPYALLRDVMAESGRTAIGRFVLRTKEYLVAIRAVGPGLVLQTMFFADEVRSPARLEEMGYIDADAEPDARKLDVARQLVDSLASDWDPTRYEDTHRARVMELVESKAQGRDFDATDAEPGADVIDLMAALEASVDRARRDRGGSGRAESGRSKRGGSRAPRSAPAGDLSGLSREELYEEAKRRDISGRSKMSKQDLIAALGEAS